MGSVVSMHLTILLDNNRNPEKKSANGLAGWAGWAGLLAGSRELSYIYIKDKPRARLARVLFGFASAAGVQERAGWSEDEHERARARARASQSGGEREHTQTCLLPRSLERVNQRKGAKKI